MTQTSNSKQKSIKSSINSKTLLIIFMFFVIKTFANRLPNVSNENLNVKQRIANTQLTNDYLQDSTIELSKSNSNPVSIIADENEEEDELRSVTSNGDSFGARQDSRLSESEIYDNSGQITSNDEPNDSSTHELGVEENRKLFFDHNTQIQAMHDILKRHQIKNSNHNTNLLLNQNQQQQIPASQELNPISIGLDAGNGNPFSLAPFGPSHVNSKPVLTNSDNIDQNNQLGPMLPFGLTPLPQLLGFQAPPFDGPARGDQSAHTNHHHTSTEPNSNSVQSVSSGKSWPKIFRFTDGRANLSEFEREKKIRLNKNHLDNQIESSPIIFDGRPLRRKSFLILHGGVFSKRK